MAASWYLPFCMCPMPLLRYFTLPFSGSPEQPASIDSTSSRAKMGAVNRGFIVVYLLGRDSVRYEFVELWIELTDKTNQPVLGISFAVVNWCHQPHQRSIGAVKPDSINHHPNFAGIFAGDDPSAPLIPVKNETLICALDHQILVDFDGSSIWGRNLQVAGAHRLP